MAVLLKGAPASEGILEEVRTLTANVRPKLVMLGFDTDPSLVSYGIIIDKMAKSVGINFEAKYFAADVPESAFLDEVERVNADASVDGVLVSMPLPEGFSFEKLQERMRPEKDVDGITLYNRALLYEGKDCFYPCTAEAVIAFLRYYKISVSGLHAVVIGRSPVVGKPTAMGLLAEDATVTICHTKTRDLLKITKEADLIVSAAGAPHLVTKEGVKEGAIVIDLGMSGGEDGKIIGDVDVKGVKEVASKIAPTLGGVGILTTAILLRHTAEACQSHIASVEEY